MGEEKREAVLTLSNEPDNFFNERQEWGEVKEKARSSFSQTLMSDLGNNKGGEGELLFSSFFLKK